MDSSGYEPSVSQHARRKFEHVVKRAGVRHLGSTRRKHAHGTRTTARVPGWKMRRRQKARPHHLRDNVYRLLQTPIRQDHQDVRLKTKVFRQTDYPIVPSERLALARHYRANR